ncbi:MAG: cytochrome c [Myxococcota bacterium]
MEESRMHSKHLLRAIALIFIALIGGLFLRGFLIPKSFGQYGFYRGDNVEQQRNLPIMHGERASCQPCHEAEFAKVMEAKHKNVQCENCHAPLANHISEGKKIAPMPKDRKATLCIRCHERLAARPKDHPQVEILKHVEEMGEKFSPEICLNCHSPHSPKEGL